MNNIYDCKKIAERLKATRKSNGYSQAEIAKECVVSRSTVIKWEKGETLPELQSLFTMCSLFDCEVGYLLCEPEYENGTKVITDICKETGLSQEAVTTLVNDAKNSKERPSFGCFKRHKLLINTILMESNRNLVNGIYSYIWFEYHRLILSNLFDLKLLESGNIREFNSLDEASASEITQLLINKKMPVIKKYLDGGGEIDIEYCEYGKTLFEEMKKFLKYENELIESRIKRGETGSDESKLQWNNVILEYDFTDEEKATLYYLFEDCEEILRDPTGKLHLFVLMETFKDFIRDNVNNIHGEFKDS